MQSEVWIAERERKRERERRLLILGEVKFYDSVHQAYKEEVVSTHTEGLGKAW